MKLFITDWQGQFNEAEGVESKSGPAQRQMLARRTPAPVQNGAGVTSVRPRDRPAPKWGQIGSSIAYANATCEGNQDHPPRPAQHAACRDAQEMASLKKRQPIPVRPTTQLRPSGADLPVPIHRLHGLTVFLLGSATILGGSLRYGGRRVSPFFPTNFWQALSFRHSARRYVSRFGDTYRWGRDREHGPDVRNPAASKEFRREGGNGVSYITPERDS